ncbi:MAG: 30S ribosomal protein S6 [Alphaproteobacteria bacterium]|nr:30S ribosomal protein S6 [Alphaproteobacteria bacterium]
MPNYEVVLIARQDVSASQVESITDEIKAHITGDGGTIARHEYWGLRNLAYRIKKNRKGHYVLLNIDAKPETLAEMERRMRLHDDILRYLTVRTEDLPEEPSIVMQRREERGRGDRDRDRDRDRGPRGGRGDRGDRGDRGGDRGDRGGERAERS